MAKKIDVERYTEKINIALHRLQSTPGINQSKLQKIDKTLATKLGQLATTREPESKLKIARSIDSAIARSKKLLAVAIGYVPPYPSIVDVSERANRALDRAIKIPVGNRSGVLRQLIDDMQESLHNVDVTEDVLRDRARIAYHIEEETKNLEKKFSSLSESTSLLARNIPVEADECGYHPNNVSKITRRQLHEQMLHDIKDHKVRVEDLAKKLDEKLKTIDIPSNVQFKGIGYETDNPHLSVLFYTPESYKQGKITPKIHEAASKLEKILQDFANENPAVLLSWFDFKIPFPRSVRLVGGKSSNIEMK